MKCVLVGDIFVPAEIMKKAAVDSGLFDEIIAVNWGPSSRPEMRNVVRVIETQGAYGLEPPEDIGKMMVGAEVIMVHLCPVQQNMLTAAPSLKVIASVRGGTENIDVDAATRMHIPVISNPAHNANAVAEYTIGMILSEQRNISRSYFALKQGAHWREKYPNSTHIPEVVDCTIGILGFGTIGRLVVDKLKGFSCKILVSDPYVNEEVIRNCGAEPCSLDYLLKESDVVTMHMRLNEQTCEFMNADRFAKMKKTAYFINTARAKLVDMSALYEALRTNSIMGAAIDVFEKEPIEPTLPILKLDNITLTNHRGGDTAASYLSSPKMVFNEVESFFEKENFKFLANPKYKEII